MYFISISLTFWSLLYFKKRKKGPHESCETRKMLTRSQITCTAHDLKSVELEVTFNAWSYIVLDVVARTTSIVLDLMQALLAIVMIR